jgi:hypothetical protein
MRLIMAGLENGWQGHQCSIRAMGFWRSGSGDCAEQGKFLPTLLSVTTTLPPRRQDLPAAGAIRFADSNQFRLAGRHLS